MMFDYLKHLMDTEDSKILFIITLITLAMVFDFITGTIAAKINKEITFNSKAGINGILRKICSIFLLIYFIPLSVLIPDGTGVLLLYTLYLGYLLMELKSIMENFNKMGLNVELFKYLIEAIEKWRDNK